MTQISRDDVQHLAQLSSLELDDSAITNLQQDIEAILGCITQLGELNTEGVTPTYQVTDLENVFRDDTVIDYGVPREQLLSLAPDAVASQVKVPKVL